MRYADTLLIGGEEIALRTRQHWLALIINARYAFLLWIAGVLLLLAPGLLNIPGTDPVSQIVGLLVLVLFVGGLVIFLIRLWQWWAQDYIVTNRRLMKVWGVLNKRSVDSSLEKINDARLDQSLFGRIFGYGHLDILTAGPETDLDDYDMINDPKGFKRAMLTQKHSLEMSYMRGAPTPPLRAAMDMNGGQLLEPAAATATAPGGAMLEPAEATPAPTAPPTPAPTAPPTPAPTAPPTLAQPAPEPVGEQPADTALEITQTLARLADLRDRGAISEDEFQAKKQELLDRL